MSRRDHKEFPKHWKYRHSDTSGDSKTWKPLAKCPLGIDHAPNGTEFGLGCTLCRHENV